MKYTTKMSKDELLLFIKDLKALLAKIKEVAIEADIELQNR
jgi:hypothetical protein